MPLAVLRLLCAFTTAAITVVSTSALAASQRTFVSSTGNDAYVCSLVAPCRSFTRALTQTNAKGEIVVLDSAAYGPVTITQSVTIIAPTGVYAGISVFTGDGVTINAGIADRVVLRGLTINGQGGSIGINFMQGALVRIESCVISNMTLYGVQHTVAGGELVILDSIVRDNGSNGILMHADGNLLLDDVRIEHNGGDGVGVLAAAGTASTHIRNSVLSYNAAGGIAAFRPDPGARTSVAVESSMIAGNAGDGVFAGGLGQGDTDVSLTRSTVAGNHLSGVSVWDGSGAISAGPVIAWLDEDLFSRNIDYAVKVEGAFAESNVTKSMFDRGNSFASFNGGVQKVYGDNSGWPAAVGGLLSVPRF